MKTLLAVLAIFTGFSAFATTEIPTECRKSLEEQKAYFETMSAKVQNDFDTGRINDGERTVTLQLIESGKQSVATSCVLSVYDAVNKSPILQSYYRLNTQSLERRAFEAREQAINFLNGKDR